MFQLWLHAAPTQRAPLNRYDPSKVRERLGYSLFRDMDVLAPRAVHARVYINGQYSGLYAAVEEGDGRFTANRFPNSGNGNLYRDLWPVDRTTTADATKALRTNADPGTTDVSDFLAFKDAVAASTDVDFATQIAPHLDFDYMARYIVVDRAINNFDGIMAFYGGWGPPPANSNHFWYHDTESGRFSLIPWDFDKIFWYPEPDFWSDNAPNWQNIVPNWNVITKNCDGYTVSYDDLGGKYTMQEIDCDPFMRQLRGKIYDSQKAIADAFIAGPFSETNVKAKLDKWQAQVANAIDDDSGVDSTQWQSALDALHADLPHFQGNLSLMMSGLIAE